MTSVFVIVTLFLTLVVGGVGKKMPEVKAFFQGNLLWDKFNFLNLNLVWGHCIIT